MMDLDSKVESLEKSDKDSRMVLPKKVVTIECMRCAPGSSEGSAKFGARGRTLNYYVHRILDYHTWTPFNTVNQLAKHEIDSS